MNRSPPASPRAAPALPLALLLGHAADALQAVRAGTSLTDALARTPADARPGTQALAFAALRRLGAAQAVRTRLAPRPPAPAVDALLLVALALLWPPEADAPYPVHTLVDQAVACAARRAAQAKAFVNAVLRRFVRERDALVAAVEADPAARWNHPRWWIERLQHDWPDRWQALLDANNAPPPLVLRVNARRLDAAAYVARLADAGIGARAAGRHAVVLDAPRPVDVLPGFAAGDVSVQDLHAQRAAPLLLDGEGTLAPLAAGARVLDACAAPGGKTAQLLELAPGIELLALDRDPARLQRVDATLARLGLAGPNVRTLAADAAAPAAWWDGRRFDAVLLDAPCTASGIVRRHPDVRWLRRPGDVAALAAGQARLLDALAPLVAPGGRLVYCTCSVFRAEGGDQIDAFLQRAGGAGWRHDPASPGALLPLADNARAPSHASGDGFFHALLHAP